MKEQLNQLILREKEVAVSGIDHVVSVLKVWDDNAISDCYMEDTLGIGVETLRITKKNKLKPYDEILSAVWLTKSQAIILRNHLDNFIQLAETELELNMREMEKQ